MLQSEGPTWEFNPESGAVKGWRAPKWHAKWRAPFALMSTAEGAEPPAETEDDPETEDDATIPLATVSEATIKRQVALLLRRLLQRADDSVLSSGRSIPGTVAIRSHEKIEPAAASPQRSSDDTSDSAWRALNVSPHASSSWSSLFTPATRGSSAPRSFPRSAPAWSSLRPAIGSEKSAASSSGPSGESPLAVDGPAAPPAGPGAPGADI